MSEQKPTFNWQDALLLDGQLDEEERLIRDSVHDFAQDRLMPLIVDWNRNEIFERELMLEFGQMGFLGGTLHGYGCPGLSHVSYGLLCRELERVDTAFRSAVGTQSGLAMGAIHSYGNEEQKQRFLPAMAKGEVLGCFGLTEPDHGSDPSGMNTRAKSSAGGYRLTGNKIWITHSPSQIFAWSGPKMTTAKSAGLSSNAVWKVWKHPRSKVSLASVHPQLGKSR